MEDSTRRGQARSSKETVSFQVMRRTLGTTAKINSRTRAILGELQVVLGGSEFALEYPHSLLLPETGSFTRFKPKRMVWLESQHGVRRVTEL